MSYVSNWRMTVACQWLRNSDDNLEQIANTVGYQDLASFSRAFKAIVGQSPARWRASLRGKNARAANFATIGAGLTRTESP